MLRDRRDASWVSASGSAEGFTPLDAELGPLDAELRDAGAQARRALHGRSQPTRLFDNRLRERLLAAYRPDREPPLSPR